MHQRPDTSLADWPVGQPACYVRTHAGPSVGHRLAQLGLRVGALLTPVQRTPGGGVVVAVGDLRLALDRASVAALQVREPASRIVDGAAS
jgi:Fe2+ transport system protein FeoA